MGIDGNNKVTFWQLIRSEQQKGIKIPRIQRDYVQGRNTPKIEFSRGRLLDDIKNALENKDDMDLNYVYGVIDEKKDKTFIPIDGQQRLTTLLCLHLYAFSKDNKTKELNELKELFRYETRISTDRFLRETAEHLKEYFQGACSDTIKKFLRNASWYQPSWDYDPSIESFTCILTEMHEKFNEIPNLSDILLCDKNCPITFMWLNVHEMGDPSTQYVKMNSRGKQLTDFENFKSELFDTLDENNPSSTIFKAKLDGDWTECVWEICEERMKDEFDPKACDELFMLLLHHIILNRLTRDLANDLSKIMKDAAGGFYNFANYKPFIIDEKKKYVDGGQILKDIYYTMQLLCFLKKNASSIWQELSIWKALKSDEKNVWSVNDLSEREKLSLFVLVKYATELPVSDWSEQSFREWNRVTNNFIRNSERGEKAVKPLYERLGALPDACLNGTYTYFANNASAIITDFRQHFQAIDETLKSKLILANPLWETSFIEAEKQKYFNGEIAFALRLIGIDENNLKADSATINKFNNNWGKIKGIFDDISDDSLSKEQWIRLRRVLLTYGDYYYHKSDYSASSDNYMMFFYCKDYNNHYKDDWRGFLRNEHGDTDPSRNSFAIFKSMFDEFLLSGKSFTDFCEEKLTSYNPPATFATDEEELKNYLITNPEMFEYIHSGGLIWKSNNNYYLINTKNRSRGTNYKLYAIHIEGRTSYCEFKTSSEKKEETNYVEINGQKIRYNAANNCYTINEAIVCDANNNPIRWINDMQLYISQTYPI